MHLELAQAIPGEKVIILHNPHDSNAQQILGTVTGIRKGEGSGGVDIVDVEYTHPVDNTDHNLPFLLDQLEIADAASEFKVKVFGQSLAILKSMQARTRNSDEIAALGVAVGLLNDKLRA